ncbi:hypothetical protein FRACYDRAFT_241107 [Fragilariopsis cylindrus CCMP1102]|uniref:DUF3494 domain-containing protein n=1 Tax=Fragilariopsis cylindrus CCMP1102 TaxID=635003 RepID=A0A1E7FAD3_9STRA|nr:hypothetical protein FRACYDRAFT_241107 [Fragilariopsis cylindrus CCMP1102]|eukprot:OEU14985.1 hypothetical protein FRACYDRAFT_241107 [Fragilariopsis cylindrus CCMP1102]
MNTAEQASNGDALEGAKTMSRGSKLWDQAEKGFLTDAERIAKNMDVGGKGHLSRQESVSLGTQFQSLKEDNQSIKKQLYGLAILCVLLCIGTIAGTVMAVKNSKDTIVDMKSGVMKVNGGTDGIDIVTVKAQGTTFQTDGSVMMNEETTTDGATFTKLVVGRCVSSEDIASMWLANEKGTDARLVIAEEVYDNSTGNTDTEISSIEPVTTGRASWNQDHIVMGDMTFIPNEECTNNSRRKLLECNDIETTDTPSFDSISMHRALKQRVDFLSGRRHLDGTTQTVSYAVAFDYRLPDSEMPDPVELGTAANYVILAAAGITNVPGSAITGDIAVSPIAATAMTGFGLVMDSTTTFSTSTEVTGKAYAADYTAPTSTHLTTAASDMLTAYNDSQGRLASINPGLSDAYNNVGAGEIGGLQLGPGVYTFNTNIGITSNVQFNGTATDIFIMRTSGSIIQAANTNVFLAGGALAENIFWSVPQTVSIGAGSHMEGILLVKTAVTMKTTSSLNGRILSQTAVALQIATVTQKP